MAAPFPNTLRRAGSTLHLSAMPAAKTFTQKMLPN
jgi:hypothetical protein